MPNTALASPNHSNSSRGETQQTEASEVAHAPASLKAEGQDHLISGKRQQLRAELLACQASVFLTISRIINSKIQLQGAIEFLKLVQIRVLQPEAPT